MNASRLGVAAALFCSLLLGGCGGGSATFEVVPISKSETGAVSTADASRAAAEGKHAGVKVNIGTEFVTVVAKGASGNAAHFSIQWPDRSKEDVDVNGGSSRDFYFAGGALGVRITVRAIR